MRKTKFFTALAITSVLFTSCYQLFQENINDSKDYGYTHATLGGLLAQKLDTTQLEAPRQIFVSQDLYSDRIEIAWSQVKGAESYRLERFISKDGNPPDEDSEYEVIPANKSNVFSSAFVYDTKYTDVVLQNPTYSDEEYNWKYYYKVYAQSDKISYENNESKSSDVKKPGTLFVTPTTVNATAGESLTSIDVTWERTPSAAEYILYRSYDENALSALEIARLKASETFFRDTVTEENQGKLTYYKIVAKNTNDNLSVQSPIAMGYSAVKGAPQAVKNVRVDPDGGRGHFTSSIKIMWDEGGDETKYMVYRSSSTDKSKTLIADLPAKTTTYTDSKKLRKNTFYYYQILPYNLAKNDDGTLVTPEVQLKGPLSKSSATDAKPCEGFILSAPSNVDIINNMTSHTIRFSLPIGAKGSPIVGKVPSENDYTYKILGSDALDGPYTEVTLSSQVISGGNFEGVIDAPKKYYQVKTVFGSVESDASEVFMPSPTAVKNVAVTKAANLSKKYGSNFKQNINGVLPVEITWEEPDGGAEGGYFVYRSTKPDKGFVKITDSPLPKTATSYLDKNEGAKTGTYYYYRVLSLNQMIKGANYSSTVMGYGALTPEQYMREYNKTIKASHKRLTYLNIAGTTEKLGEETVNGVEGTLHYNAKISGLGARIIMHYEKYVEFYINDDKSQGPYFNVTGDTNTSAQMDSSGTMDGTVECSGMYNGSIGYGKVQIKNGNAGGGSYIITREGFDPVDISWTVGEEK